MVVVVVYKCTHKKCVTRVCVCASRVRRDVVCGVVKIMYLGIRTLKRIRRVEGGVLFIRSVSHHQQPVFYSDRSISYFLI
jgi:hypothetical protein